MKYAPWALWILLPVAMLFRLNFSPSEPMGLYLITEQALKPGAFVLLHSPLKQIVGGPGDTVTVTPAGSYVNGKLIRLSAVPGDSAFTHCPYGTYHLRPHQLWILGSHPNSWDSRYFCAVPQTLVSSTAQPLWTSR